jgi:hypothetical protein
MFARLKVVEVPMAVRAEIEAHDVIEEALKEPGLYDEILESVQSGDREIDPPSKWWTPLISSCGSRKVFYGYSASSIHG